MALKKEKATDSDAPEVVQFKFYGPTTYRTIDLQPGAVVDMPLVKAKSRQADGLGEIQKGQKGALGKARDVGDPDKE